MSVSRKRWQTRRHSRKLGSAHSRSRMIPRSGEWRSESCTSTSGSVPRLSARFEAGWGRIVRSRTQRLRERNLREAVPTVPGRSAGIWSAFPHAFGGISRVTSRVNYLVPRASRIAQRSPLALRYLRHRDVVRKLERLAGCRFVRQTGGHEIWETPAGHRFPIPNHRTEIADGTLRAILKQAGLDMSVREFMSPRG